MPPLTKRAAAKAAARLAAEPPLNRKLRRVCAGATNARGTSPLQKGPININKDPKAKTFSRTEIVSEKLCDDLIEYLAPTLRPYKGCTILDVHPGACLWSQKLHEFLKPRCHILMEPEKRYMKDFIQPLLNKRHSRYRHSRLEFIDPASGSYRHPYAQALDDVRRTVSTDIPSLSTSSLAYDDHRLRLLNAGLLVTGNLSRLYSKKLPQHILYREVIAALDNSLVHRNGLIRMLWWLPDNPKVRSGVNPHLITGRTSGNVMLGLAADVTEAVGVELSTKPAKDGSKATISHGRARNPAIILENKKEVYQRMRVAGMQVPEGRELFAHPDAPDDPGRYELFARPDGTSGELKDPFAIRYHTREEVGRAIDEFDTFLDTFRARGTDSGNNGKASSLRNYDLGELVKEIEYPQCVPAALEDAPQRPSEAESRPDKLAAQVQRKAIYLDITLRMLNLETHVVVLREKGIDIEEFRIRLLKLDQEIQKQIMEGLPALCANIIEDQMLHFCRPQIFMYDRRAYEPLRATVDDFWPKAGLTLYDCVPSTRDMDVADIADRNEVAKLARELCKQLYFSKASPVPAVLDRIALNAAQDLIPKVPALTDPRRGGRLNPNNVTARMVSEETFEELVKAWFEWPFKPDRYDLEINAMGNMQPTGQDEMTPERAVMARG